MAEQEGECHFCHFCGADDVSAPFIKDVEGHYVCPECKRSYCLIAENEADEVFPCFCGKKPRVDRKRLYIGCPNHCASFIGNSGEEFSRLINQWNKWVLFVAKHTDELF